MSDHRNRIYAFGEFSIDTHQRLLFARDQMVTLQPRAFDLLLLVEHKGKVLSKEELMRLVWADQYVEENNLAQNIHKLRKALGDGRGGTKYIETIPKRGYRFVAEVEAKDEPPTIQPLEFRSS